MIEPNESSGELAENKDDNPTGQPAPWNAPDFLMDPSPDATAGETDIFGIPVQKDLFGDPAVEHPKKK